MRAEKKSIVDEYSSRLSESSYQILVDYRGLSVEQLASLRSELSQVEARLQIVKNAFLKWAAKGLDRAEFGAMLKGPTAILTGSSDLAKTAKTLRKFIKSNSLPVVKGGMADGKVLSASDVDVMAKLPSREIMLSILVGTVASPMTGIVGVLSQKLASLVYVLKAIEEKKKNS